MWNPSHLGVLPAFLAGLVSFLSPCVLPLVPGYLSYVAGSTAEIEGPRGPAATVRATWLSFLFVLGFSAVFVALGAAATAIGQLLLDYRYETNLLGGAIVALFGLFMTGLLPLAWLQRDLRFHRPVKRGQAVGACTLGAAFAFGWTPCIGPVLGSILTLSASSDRVGHGVGLLSVYSMGLGTPFVAAAALTEAFMRGFRTMRRIGRPLQVAAGFVMITMGAAIMTGQMSVLAIWFLQTFPILQSIG